MKTLIASLLLVITATGTSFGGATKGTYRGTTSSTIYYLDALTGRVTGTRTYNSTTVITIGNPASVSTSVKERNPFSLVARPPATLRGGEVSLLSAFAGNVGSVRNFLLQYWTFTNTSNGFTGRLTNNGSSYGLVMNTVNAWSDLVPGRPSLGGRIMPFSFYDAKYGSNYQASLAATQTGTRLTMQVQGWSVAGSTLAYVVSTVNATR